MGRGSAVLFGVGAVVGEEATVALRELSDGIIDKDDVNELKGEYRVSGGSFSKGFSLPTKGNRFCGELLRSNPLAIDGGDSNVNEDNEAVGAKENNDSSANTMPDQPSNNSSTTSDSAAESVEEPPKKRAKTSSKPPPKQPKLTLFFKPKDVDGARKDEVEAKAIEDYLVSETKVFQCSACDKVLGNHCAKSEQKSPLLLPSERKCSFSVKLKRRAPRQTRMLLK